MRARSCCWQPTSPRAPLRAAELHDERGARIESGRARTLAGRALAAAGQQGRALSVLESAHHDLRACGAARFGDAAAHELRKLGRRVQRGGRRPGAASGAAALSPREREIAALVARGRSNKEIAAQLHLSGYIVENHLRKVFAKLAVSKRSAVAAALAAQGDSVL